jgi:hypothetical protein
MAAALDDKVTNNDDDKPIQHGEADVRIERVSGSIAGIALISVGSHQSAAPVDDYTKNIIYGRELMVKRRKFEVNPSLTNRAAAAVLLLKRDVRRVWEAARSL